MFGQWDKVQHILKTDPGICKHLMDGSFYNISLFLPLVIFYWIQLLKLLDNLCPGEAGSLAGMTDKVGQ